MNTYPLTDQNSTEIDAKKIDLMPEKDSNLFLFSFQIVICGFIYFSSQNVCVSFNICRRIITVRPVTAAFAAGLTSKCMGQKRTTQKNFHII
jgi:hypothetical protein